MPPASKPSSPSALKPACTMRSKQPWGLRCSRQYPSCSWHVATRHRPTPPSSATDNTATAAKRSTANTTATACSIMATAWCMRANGSKASGRDEAWPPTSTGGAYKANGRPTHWSRASASTPQAHTPARWTHSCSPAATEYSGEPTAATTTATGSRASGNTSAAASPPRARYRQENGTKTNTVASA